MVVRQPQSPRHISRRDRRPIAKRQNPVNAFAGTRRFQHGVSRNLRRFKMHRNRPIPPRIIQLMTPVRNKRQLHPKLPRRRIKAPSLIPQFLRKNQNPFACHRCDIPWACHPLRNSPRPLCLCVKFLLLFRSRFKQTRQRP